MSIFSTRFNNTLLSCSKRIFKSTCIKQNFQRFVSSAAVIQPNNSGIDVPPSSIPKCTSRLRGEQLLHSLDLSQVHIGQVIEIPYEMTFDPSHSSLWQSSMQHHDRLYSSTPFAQSLNFHSHVVPYSLMLFQAISMAHVDETREVLDLELDNAVYIRPAFSGDTFKQTFTIKHLRNTSDGKSTIMKVGCELHNQKQQLVFSVDKTMLYRGVTAPHRLSLNPPQPTKPTISHLLAHILYNGDALPKNSTLAILHAHQLILHSVQRPIGINANMSLSTLFRWTHPLIYNIRRYEDTIVPSGLILAATLSATSRGFFECLYESVESCQFINKCTPHDMIGAISFVQNIKTLKEGFEQLHIITLGLKNIELLDELSNIDIPVELFTNKLKPTVFEQFVRENCPVLNEKVLTVVHRNIVRQSPYSQQRAIPLL